MYDVLPRNLVRFRVFGLLAPCLLAACSGTPEGTTDEVSGDVAAVTGRCVTAPLSEKLQKFGGSGLIPPFAALSWASAESARYAGSWAKVNEGPLATLTSPHRVLGSAAFYTLEAPTSGAYVLWTFPRLESEQGKFSIYAYVPDGAKNRNARYAIYLGGSQTASKVVAIDQTKRSAAEVVLNSRTFRFQNWVFLGEVPLHEGARISLDGSAGAGSLVADTVVAVKWGCAQSR